MFSIRWGGLRKKAAKIEPQRILMIPPYKNRSLIWRFIDWQGYTYMYKHEKHRFIDLYVWDDDLLKCVHLHYLFYSAKLTHEAVWYLSFHFCFDLFLLFLFLESFEDMNLLWFWFCLKYETRNKNIYNVFLKTKIISSHVANNASYIQ